MMHKGRFWELDLIRGIAVVMMVIFHLAFDLSFFGIYAFDIYSGFWFYFARITASIFILLVGVSLVLVASQFGEQRQDELRLEFLKRGMKIFSFGLGITAATYFLIGNGFIIFGVLHLIGLSIILAYPFLNFRTLNVVIGVTIIAVGLHLESLAFNFPWLLWLGLAPTGFYTLDYFPLLPWFGLVLIGVYLGDALYKEYKSRVELPDLSTSVFLWPIILLGKNSLVIYLVHQPLLILALYLIVKVNITIPLQ